MGVPVSLPGAAPDVPEVPEVPLFSPDLSVPVPGLVLGLVPVPGVMPGDVLPVPEVPPAPGDEDVDPDGGGVVAGAD
jgi:hypothetical protein